MKPPPMNFLDEQPHLCEIHFFELKAGRCRQRVATRILRFRGKTLEPFGFYLHPFLLN
ncbi:unnamed protein product [Brassica rapa subsp. trilocularis]